MISQKRRKRKRNRLSGFDYSQSGYYYATICTENKIDYFGQVKSELVVLNQLGEIASKFWREIPEHYEGVRIDEFVVMPNHVHGIVVLENSSSTVRTEQCSVLTYGRISKIVKSYKNAVTTSIHAFGDSSFQWQRSFYDHVIRNEKSLFEIREYIRNNPLKWNLDENNPENLTGF